MFKIAIIIPVYNAEKYLRGTIESVINQNIGFENIELILVDDCSTDSSRDIISYYDDKYDNVLKYFSDVNHGLPGFGRNWGIKNASADYVLFLDNDDLLDYQVCEKLYSIAVKEQADICGSNKIICDNGREVKYPLDGYDEEYLVLNDDNILTFNNITIHGKIYKRSFLLENNIRFPEELSFEDFIFSTKCYAHAKKLVYLDTYYGYVWNLRDNSLSRSNKKYILGNLKASYILLNFLKKEKKEKYSPFVFRATIRILIRDAFTLNVDFNTLKNLLKQLYEFEKEIDFNIVKEQLWISIINFFVIHKAFNVATILIKLIGKTTNNNFIKSIFRKIKEV